MLEQEFLLASCYCTLTIIISVVPFHKLYVQRKKEILEMKLGIFSVFGEIYYEVAFCLGQVNPLE